MKAQKQTKITNSEIAHIKTLRDMAKALKDRLDKLEIELETNEAFVISLLDSGALNASSFNISVNETSRKHPKYKEEIEKRLGEVVLNEIIQNTESRISKKLVIAA